MLLCVSCCSISMKVDTVVAESIAALADGKCVVIGLQNTGEVRTVGQSLPVTGR